MEWVRRLVFAVFVLGLAVTAGCTASAPDGPASLPSAATLLVLPVSLEVEARLNQAPGDTERLDILAREACNREERIGVLVNAGIIIPPDNQLEGEVRGLNHRYGNIQRRVPAGPNSLSDYEDKLCPGVRPPG